MKTSIKSPWVWTAAALVVSDQLTKYLISSQMYPGQTIDVAPFFSIVYAMNTGISFSMFQGSSHLFAVLTALVIGGFLLWYRKNRAMVTPVMKTAFTLIMAGATGNLIDRLVHGYVIDFIDVSIGTYHWPAFNVADSSITIGGILLFFLAFSADRSMKEGKQIDG